MQSGFIPTATGKKLLAATKQAAGGDSGNVDVSSLRESTEIQRKWLKQTELDVRQSTQKVRDLAINIKLVYYWFQYETYM